jgi:hypothetical protein
MEVRNAEHPMATGISEMEWLKQYATIWKVVGSKPDEVNYFVILTGSMVNK